MALTVTEANTVSTQIYDKTITPQVYDSIDFLKWLRANGKVIKDGGTQLSWPIRYKKLGRATDVGWGDQEDFQTVSTRTQAILQWIPYRASTLITWEERVKNGKGKTRVVNLTEDKSKEVSEDMKDRLATDLWATSSVSGHMIPMYTIVDDADTYAGITVSDAAIWAGKEDSSTTKMTRALFHTQVHAARFGSDGPSRYYTTHAIAAAYESLLSADERYVKQDKMSTGPEAIGLYNDPVLTDPYITSGDFFGLDADKFEFWVHEDNDMDVSPWMELGESGYHKSMAKYVTNVCNLVCRERRTSFKLTALTGT